MWKTTHWSQILEAQKQDQYALEKLCKDYWEPVYKFVSRYCKNDAEDMTQEFFTVFLENRWVERVSKTKGKFRTFLLTALVRFIKDKKQKKQNTFERNILYDGEYVEFQETKSFNRYWIENLLHLVEVRMHKEYRVNKDCDYLIFKSYFCYTNNIFFKPQDIVCINDFFYDVAKNKNGNAMMDKLLSEISVHNIANDEQQVYESLSQYLNNILITFDLEQGAFCEDYLLCSMDFLTTNWQYFKEDITTKIISDQNAPLEVKANMESIMNFLNRLILHQDLDYLCRDKNFTQNTNSRIHKNRLIVENIFDKDIIKYSIRRNRQIINDYYKPYFTPLFNKQPSYLKLAEYFSISKHQVEKSLKKTISTYKTIMQDEVARYVCPQEVTEEIAYLQNIL